MTTKHDEDTSGTLPVTENNTERQQQSTSDAETEPSTISSNFLPPLKPQDFDRTGKLSSNVSMAATALWANRLRSLLTILGIVIGVSTVVAMVILIQGTNAYYTNQLASLGANVIFLSPGTNNKTSGSPTSSMSSAPSATGTTLSLTPGDAQAITKLPDVTVVSPIISANEQAIVGNQHWNTTIEGVDVSLSSMRNWRIQEGAQWSASDEQDARSVAVLGQTVYQHLFADGGEDPIGQNIRIGTVPYRVIGVLAALGGTSTSDDVVYMPETTALERLKNTGYVDQILVQVDDTSTLLSVQQAITRLLEQRHHITGGMADDFTLTTSTQLLQDFNQSVSLGYALLVGVASLSLTVGGVGIMNIMIVSVTERTREIGIRMALGATRPDIRNQFLIEALTLSLVGGMIGLLLGLLMGYGTTRMFGVSFMVTPISLLLPFVVSAGVGVLFGFYPAARAAQLDPIEALRSLYRQWCVCGPGGACRAGSEQMTKPQATRNDEWNT